MFREDNAHEKGLICIADNKILQENLLLAWIRNLLFDFLGTGSKVAFHMCQMWEQ